MEIDKEVVIIMVLLSVFACLSLLGFLSIFAYLK